MRYPEGFAALTMDPLSIEQITQFAGAVRQNGGGERLITHLSTDSRTLQPGDLFVALRGENFDGHKFVKDAALRGAAGAMVEQEWSGKTPPDFRPAAGFGHARCLPANRGALPSFVRH